MNIIIREIDRAHRADINIPNQPFPLFGRLLPSYVNGQWSWREQRFPESEVSEMCFPDENYDYDKLSQNSVFLGAYDDEKCIGLAILQQAWNRYMYLYDLKVNREYRGQRIGEMLIAAALDVSRAHGYRGLFTQGQDNNLAACRFYLKNGFEIGGIDTRVYRGTRQEGKFDVLFYAENAPKGESGDCT